MALRQVSHVLSCVTRGDRGDADPEPTVLLRVDADVVAAVLRRGLRGGPVHQGAPEVLLLEHLAEALRPQSARRNFRRARLRSRR